MERQLGGNDLQRWLIDSDVPRGKIDGQLMRVVPTICNQKKARIEDYGPESSHCNKKIMIPSLALGLDLFSDLDPISEENAT